MLTFCHFASDSFEQKKQNIMKLKSFISNHSLKTLLLFFPRGNHYHEFGMFPLSSCFLLLISVFVGNFRSKVGMALSAS